MVLARRRIAYSNRLRLFAGGVAVMTNVRLDTRSIRYWRGVNGRVDHEERNRYAAAVAVGLAILLCAALTASAIASA
jgi:hypothetical protein